MRRDLLFVLYPLILLSLYPVIEFEIYRYTDGIEPVSAFFYWFRLFFSGPLLIITGIILVWLYKAIHKAVGFATIAVGIYWVALLLSEFLSEKGAL
jgi:hypothetical protein